MENMIDPSLADAVIEWHRSNGGNGSAPAGHALKLLEEVIELCVASGASVQRIINVVDAEITKASRKNEIGKPIEPDKMGEEFADCEMLMRVFSYYFVSNERGYVADKLKALGYRKWEVNEEGVLRRPGRKEGDNGTA